MKKLLSLSAAFVALALVSCNKESADSITLPEGKLVSFTLDVPRAADAADENGGEVKVSFGERSENSIPVLWNSGDAFRLFTCLPESEYTITYDGEPASATNILIAPTEVTDCGKFTTNDDNVPLATFTGTIPEGAQSETEGMAIFPASAYKEGTATMSASKHNSAVEGLIRVTTEIPANQDGTGMKYLIATSRLKNGSFSNFTFSTSMVKITIPEGLGIDTAVLSAPTSYAKALGGSQISLYYYFGSNSCSLSNTKGQIWSITVSRDGAELSGDIYFVTRNTDAWSSANNAEFTLTFRKGTEISKPMKAKMKAMGGGKMLDFGTVTPTFGEQTVITYDRDVLKTPENAFTPTVEGEMFPCVISSSSPYQLSVASDKSEMDYTWYNSEHKYTFGGYEWTFGSTKVFASTLTDNKGMFFYTGKTNCSLRIESGGTYIKFPVVTGKKLAAMSISIANAKEQVWWKIAKEKEAKNFLAGASAVTMNKDSGLVTVNFTDTEVNTPYYFISYGSTQPVKLILYYQ